MKKRGMFCSKKGDMTTVEILFLIIGLILVLIIGEGLFTLAKTLKENSLFEKNALSRDLSLLIMTITATPNDITYYYTSGLDLKKYQFDFDNSMVSVKEIGKEKPLVISYPYADNPNINKKFQSIKGSSSIIIIKEKDTLTIKAG